MLDLYGIVACCYAGIHFTCLRLDAYLRCPGCKGDLEELYFTCVDFVEHCLAPISLLSRGFDSAGSRTHMMFWRPRAIPRLMHNVAQVPLALVLHLVRLLSFLVGATYPIVASLAMRQHSTPEYPKWLMVALFLLIASCS